MRPALALPLALSLLSGCATFHPRLITSDGPPLTRQVEYGRAVFLLEYVPADERTAKEVEEAIRISVPRLERWGGFTQPVTVRIQPSHEALETAVRREGWPWLRAWARYDSVDLQSPRTWALLGASQGQVVELLTHELTHCLMYQRAATAADWSRKEIPLWFREGMASYTAEQGYRRPTDEDLFRYLRANPNKNPVVDADSLYQREADIVYGSAHRTFEYLVGQIGEKQVNELLATMRAGASFPEAFEQHAGQPLAAFEVQYVEYVKSEGFRTRKIRSGTPSGAAGDPVGISK